MKILYYTDQTHRHGGIERVLANKINYLSMQKGLEIFLITTEQKRKPHCYTMHKSLQHIDLEININREKSYFHPVNLRKLPKHYHKLKKLLNKINPDIVITPNYDYAFYLLPFIHRKSKKIKEFHSSKYFESIKKKNTRSFIKKILFKLNDYIESKYDALVVLTPDELKHFKSTNTRVIPNAIRVEHSEAALLNAPKAISAGRLAPVKGFDKLIEAWAIVSKKHPDWKLEIYGEGDNKYTEKLQRQIQRLNLEKYICLCGKTDELDKKMLEASCYIMSSKTECFPMVLLEAQSLGLPVVSFDCPYGPRNIITENGDGFLVENQNTNVLAERILLLIENTDTRIQLGANAKKNIKKLSLDNIMPMWSKLFDELLIIKK